MSLPGVCSECGAKVTWTGSWWSDRGKGKRRHICGPIRLRCGKWMPQARAHCARLPSHDYPCRSRYAMDNDYRLRRGKSPRWAAA